MLDGGNRPLIVDSFAGGGGASTGIEMALGRSPDIAINHSADALAMHAVNHPDTVHLDSNIWDVSPSEVCKGRHVGLLWASPDCKHFSKAKGGKPLDRNIRDLAWVVVRWAEEVRPDVILLENVEEFRTWGPIYEDGTAIAQLRGQTFADWVKRLKKAGYKVQHRELRACDYGAPTIRKRLFLVARCDGRPIVWPKPTHGKPDDPDVIKGKKLPWRTAAEIIDWSIPCPSIFESSEEIMAKYGVRAIRPLADATMRRIARGVVRYVLEAKKPFIVKFQSNSTGHSIDEPLATVTANSFIKRPGGSAPLGVVVPSLERVVETDGYAVSFGQRHELADGTQHVPFTIAPIVTAAQHGGSVRGADEPLHTITASRKDQNAVIVPTLAAVEGPTCPRCGNPCREDDNSIACDRCEMLWPKTPDWDRRLLVPSFVGCGGRAGQSAPRGGGEPLGTLTAKADGCVVAPYLVPRYQEREGQHPRVRSVEEPAATIVPGGNEGVLAAVHLSRFTQNGIGAGADEPLDTVMAGAPKFGVVAAFLAQHNTGEVGHDARSPVSTVVQKGCTQGVVAASLMNMHGADRRDSSLDAPAPTVTAGGNHAALISGFLTKYYGQGDGAAVDGPLHTDTTKDRFGLVTVEIDGQSYAIADIGMRMLTPRERFRAQGFPDSYIIDRRPDGSPITQTVQGSCCGNSVSPPLAEALAAANCGHLIEFREAAE